MSRKERIAFVFSRIALFIVFAWFGALKLLALSPAGPLVADLFNKTIGPFLPFLSIDAFMVFFGAFEILIGLLFVIPRMEKWAIALLIPHMITTTMPLFMAVQMTWTGFLSPSLEGQYIIKNVVIIALVGMLYVSLDKNYRKI